MFIFTKIPVPKFLIHFKSLSGRSSGFYASRRNSNKISEENINVAAIFIYGDCRRSFEYVKCLFGRRRRRGAGLESFSGKRNFEDKTFLYTLIYTYYTNNVKYCTERGCGHIIDEGVEC